MNVSPLLGYIHTHTCIMQKCSHVNKTLHKCLETVMSLRPPAATTHGAACNITYESAAFFALCSCRRRRGEIPRESQLSACADLCCRRSLAAATAAEEQTLILHKNETHKKLEQVFIYGFFPGNANASCVCSRAALLWNDC
jgi:hypothetical protein